MCIELYVKPFYIAQPLSLMVPLRYSREEEGRNLGTLGSILLQLEKTFSDQSWKIELISILKPISVQ